MKFEELRSRSRLDLEIGDELDREAQALPKKKAQWSEWLSVYAIECKKADWAYRKIQRERFEYYYSDYHLTLDKKDIREIYLPGDDEVVEAAKRLELAKQKVELCERTIKNLTAVGFDIKNVIEYRKLMSGII